MNKQIFILAMAALGFVACSSDETIASQATSEANEISFRPNVAGQTRAITETTTTEFTSSHSFYAAAYKNSDHTQYFAVDEFKSIASNNYRGAKTYYWPDYALDFYAWYPGSNAQLSHSTYNEFLFVPSETVTDHKDFVIAATINKSKPSPAAGVELAFKHLGTWIEVKVYNSKGTTTGNLNATVSGWKLGYLHKGGVYTIAGSTADGSALPTTGGSGWSYSSYNAVNQSNVPAEYKVASLNANFVSGTTGNYSTTGNAVSIGEAIIVPQETTKMNSAQTKVYNAGGYASGAFIALKLQLADGDSHVLADATGVDNSSHDLWAIWPVTNDWVAGTKYTYTIDVSQGGYKETGTATTALDKWFDNAEIYFSSVSVSHWNSSNGSVGFE